jgi:DNA-binding MarR family transcriptional regulator
VTNRSDLIGTLIWEIRATQAAVDAVDDAFADYLGVNRTDARCLDILERDGPMPAGELARAVGLTTGAVTAVLDRLERAGYARRTRDREDRRRVLVDVTPKVRRAAEEVFDVGNPKAFEDFFANYSDGDLQLLIDFHRHNREMNAERLAFLKQKLERRSRRRAAG